MAESDVVACRRCGAPLESQYCTTCGLDSRCTSCGASIISPFCINCGTVAPASAAAGTMLAVGVDPQAQVPVSSRLEEGDVSASGRNIWHRNTRSLLIIAGLIAATIVLAGSAVALIGGGGDSHNSASSKTADVVESPSTSIAATTTSTPTTTSEPADPNPATKPQVLNQPSPSAGRCDIERWLSQWAASSLPQGLTLDGHSTITVSSTAWSIRLNAIPGVTPDPYYVLMPVCGSEGIYASGWLGKSPSTIPPTTVAPASTTTALSAN
jgi:hypothetical protein